MSQVLCRWQISFVPSCHFLQKTTLHSPDYNVNPISYEGLYPFRPTGRPSIKQPLRVSQDSLFLMVAHIGFTQVQGPQSLPKMPPTLAATWLSNLGSCFNTLAGYKCISISKNQQVSSLSIFYAWLYIYMYTNEYVYTYIYMYIYVYVHINICSYMSPVKGGYTSLTLPIKHCRNSDSRYRARRGRKTVNRLFSKLGSECPEKALLRGTETRHVEAQEVLILVCCTVKIN